jgi:tetratricopeptide (TPR) repeat protein
MADDLYERYKEALRTGHVAVLRGALQEALKAYRLAAQIAPSRAMPHTSMGGVYLRMGDLDEALAEYEAAVQRAPHDEGALLGHAEALTSSGMRPEAALVLDHVVDIQEAAGRLPEACDTLRRALDLDDNPERGKRQRALVRQIRFSAGDKAAEQKLARALRLRDEEPEAPTGAPPPEVAPARKAAEMPDLPEPALSPTVAFTAFVSRPTAKPEAEPAAAAKAEPEPEPERLSELERDLEPEPAFGREIERTPALEYEREFERTPEPMAAEPEPMAAEPEPMAAEPEPEPEPTFESLQPAPVAVMADAEVVFGPVGPGSKGGPAPNGDELLVAAEAADAAGDTSSLRSLLLWTARAYAREGRFEAGLDAAHRLLQRDPNDVDAHLALVELYLARRWDGLAADKLRLLGKLAEFNDDQATRRRLSVVASRAFPEDAALASSLS